MTIEEWIREYESMTEEEQDELKQAFLRKELRKYEEKVPMTCSERKEVRSWVHEGNETCKNHGIFTKKTEQK